MYICFASARSPPSAKAPRWAADVGFSALTRRQHCDTSKYTVPIMQIFLHIYN